MSGENSLQTSAEKIQKIDNRINSLHAKYGIKSEMVQMDLAKMDGAECVERAHELSIIAFTIQQEVNRLKSKYNFIDTNIKRMIYPILENYQGWGNDVKFNSALNEVSSAKELHNVQTQLKVDLDALEFITRRIDTVIDLLKEASKNRRSDRWKAT